MENSEIKINLPNTDTKTIAKIQNCFIELLDTRFFEIDRGKVQMNFVNGDLMDIWVESKVFRRKKADNELSTSASLSEKKGLL